MLGSQLTVAQLQAPCIWFFPHTLPSSSLFLPVTSSSDPRRNHGWKKSRETLPLYSMLVAFPQSQGLSAVGFDMKGEGKKNGRNVVAALLPHSFPCAVCKVHHFIECSEISQACPWRAVDQNSHFPDGRSHQFPWAECRKDKSEAPQPPLFYQRRNISWGENPINTLPFSNKPQIIAIMQR